MLDHLTTGRYEPGVTFSRRSILSESIMEIDLVMVLEEEEEEVEGDAEEEDVDLGFMVFIIAPVGPAAIARVLPHMGRSMSREAHYTILYLVYPGTRSC